MNLHRASGQPEWDAVPLARRSIWQRTAASTHGFVTIGNFFSLIGLLSVPFGLWIISNDNLVAGAVVLVLGRACDLIDGWAADLTHTKSPLGETIDASFDKVSTGLTIVGLIALGTIPLAIAFFLMAPQLLITTLSLVANHRGVRMHPTQAGKLSMGLLWVTMVSFLLTGHSDQLMSKLAAIVAALLAVVALAVGVVAMIGYARDFQKIPKQNA